MAFFWDLFDSVNSARYDLGQDTVQFTPAAILYRLSENYPSFPDFYNGFVANGWWGASATAVEQLRIVNGLNVSGQ